MNVSEEAALQQLVGKLLADEPLNATDVKALNQFLHAGFRIPRGSPLGTYLVNHPVPDFPFDPATYPLTMTKIDWAPGSSAPSEVVVTNLEEEQAAEARGYALHPPVPPPDRAVVHASQL